MSSPSSYAAVSDNEDDGEILLPGLGMPVNYLPEDQWEKMEGSEDLVARCRFPNAITDWAARNILVREQTMLAIANDLTDKPDWHKKVHDEKIAQKWKHEAVGKDGVDCSEKMFDYCIAELRDKGARFERTGSVVVLDSEAAVVKSDSAIPPSLRQELRAAVKPLEDVPERLKDWHPGSGEKVLDLVHPSLYPLIYGKSRVLSSGQISLHDTLGSCGKGDIIPKPERTELDLGEQFNLSSANGLSRPGYREYGLDYWSDSYQWLPCEVAFGEDDEVQITSYINNLHPRHINLYKVLEKIIAKTIPLWNDCLSYFYFGEPRLRLTNGGQGAEYLYPQGEQRPLGDGENSDDDDRWEKDEQWLQATRVLVQPEPEEYVPYDPQILDSVDLRKAEDGIQVIVKLANIELRPEEGKTEYEGGTWHVEGQLNEHICASAIYYYDQKNISESRLAFRQSTTPEDVNEQPYGQYEYHGLEALYGIEQGGPCLQTLGAVLTKEGRLVVFPNVLQHQVQPFRLVDPTKPGHRKILALFLVDPFMRTISTAHVPPQRKDWWAEVVSEDTTSRLGKLPRELIDRIIEMTDDWPISLEEAKEVREDLMSKRKMYVDKVNAGFEVEGFSFCEH